jgi:hypothetical protein
VEKNEIMRIWRQPSTVPILIGQKQLNIVEYFNCLGNMITNDARCTGEIKTRIALEKAAFNTNKIMYGVETWDISDSRPEIPGRFLNVVLEKNGKDVGPIL